jgi:hypothetical protein
MERELWTLLYAVAARLDNGVGKWLYSTSDIVMVYFWAALHDRPMRWATCKANWPDDLRPGRLPSQSTLSRRMRCDDACQLMGEIEAMWLVLAGVAGYWLRVIDGKPLTVSPVSKDIDAAFGRGAGGQQRGYKLFAVWGGGPLPISWALAPMNKNEKTMARELISTLPGGGYLVGDAEYDAAPLFDLAHEAGVQLMTPKVKGKGLGHRRQSPNRLRSIELMQRPFGKGLFRFRRQIERDFGELTSFGGGLMCLPPWVRRFHRVRHWVHAKLLINAARWFTIHPELPAVA